MKTNKLILIFLLFIGISAYAQDDEIKGDDSENEAMLDVKLVNQAEEAKAMFMKENDKIDQEFKKAKAHIIFPNVGEGALIVGIASGHGIVYEGNEIVGMAKMKKIDVGLQAGGQAYREVIFFNSDEAFYRFKKNKLEFSAGASATVLKSGKSIEAKYNDGVAVYAIPKAGLMAEAAVGGQSFIFEPTDE